MKPYSFVLIIAILTGTGIGIPAALAQSNAALAPTTSASTKAPATVNTSASASTSSAVATPTTTTSSAVTSVTVAAKKKAADDALAAYKAAKAVDKLAKLQKLGDALIDHRITSLGEITGKLTTNTLLTTDQVTSVLSTVKTTTDGLTALKAKIDADTTVADAKTDVMSIFSTYRVFAVFEPMIHLTISADEAQSILTKLTALTAKVQAAIDAKKTAGTDATALTTALTDYSNQLSDIQKLLDDVKVQIGKMIPSDVVASATAAKAARADLTKIRADVVAARGDITTMRDALKVTAAAPTSSTTTTTTTTSPATGGTTTGTTTTGQ